MLDPLISLAFTIYSNSGAYALLIGSGVSRSAQIPTGWDIVEDLIAKIANSQGEDPRADVEKWFVDKYKSEPNYSSIVGELAKTPTERKELLRNYFEPNAEEKKDGVKIPQTAHHAIAELVKKGYIKVIVTTNFDRLLENSLEDVGVVAQVIDNEDAIEGATPLAHVPCTVIKVHGDYLDSRIRNLASELDTYDKKTNDLLDRVFDEYGLVVCGWSGTWDKALRAVFERRKNRRYAIYWTLRGVVSEETKPIIELNQIQQIDIKDADTFFQLFGTK